MATDKELAALLLDTLEELYLEKIALASVLITNESRLPPEMRDWRKYLKWMKEQSDVRERVRERIAPLRQRMEQDQSLSTVIEEFLRIVPPGGEIH